MSPFRWDVLLVGLVLAVPVLALGVRGDLSTEEMVTRLPWCLAAGWAGGALLRFASAPRTPEAGPRAAGAPRAPPPPGRARAPPPPGGGGCGRGPGADRLIRHPRRSCGSLLAV